MDCAWKAGCRRDRWPNLIKTKKLSMGRASGAPAAQDESAALLVGVFLKKF
jgi:hypothetical protein